MLDHNNDHMNVIEPPQMENNFDIHPNEHHMDHQEMPIYHHPPNPIQQTPHHQSPGDIFSELDKTAYIVMFVAFILGFFMGKTMNPVIIRGHI